MQLKLLPRPRRATKDPGVRKTVKLMVPALFGVSVGQISLLLDTLLASFLVTGSISWLYYSDRLMEFPWGSSPWRWPPSSCPLCRSAMPRTTRRPSPTHGLGAALGPVAGRALRGRTPGPGRPMIATLFYSGEFGANDVEMAAEPDGLLARTGGLHGDQGLGPGYYARQDMRTPVRIAVIALSPTWSST
jgi:putative peptidoglycan lipid II flippase